MSEYGRIGRVLRVSATIFWTLGGILLAVVGFYASAVTPSPHHVPVGSRDPLRSMYNLLLDIMELARRDPVGGPLAWVSIMLLVFGTILYVVGGYLMRKH